MLTKSTMPRQAALLLAALSPAALAAPTQTWPNIADIDPAVVAAAMSTPSLLAVDPPGALPQRATANDIRWQPVMDFDTDGCYNVPAIDSAGNIVQGLEHNNVGASEDCRDESDLDNNNVYSRARCNNGWCAYLYDYYFEKDIAIPNFPFDPGHTHDWEHVVIWVQGDEAKYVAVSAHGEYEIKPASEVRFDGDRAKVVYHKDGVSTHCFRFGNEDDEAIENHKGVWFRGPLVGYNGFPGGLRDSLVAHDFGSASIAFKDASFQGNLDRARPEGITFDTGVDDGSPGNP